MHDTASHSTHSRSFASLLLAVTLLTACGGGDGAVMLRDQECLECHPAAELATVTVTGPARAVMDALGNGFREEVGARVDFPKRGNHGPDDLEACTTCHIGHVDNDDVAQNRNIFPAPALNLLHEPGANCATGCHDWLKPQVFETGFPNVFGLLPFFEGDLDPFRLLKESTHAGFRELLTGDRTPRHKQILREGWEAERRGMLFPMLADHYEPGCGGCHDLSGEQRHGEIPSCNDCHSFTREKPPGTSAPYSTHEYLVETTDLFLPLAAPEHNGKESCEFCHRETDTPGPETELLTRRICYNCHISAHQPNAAPLILAFWESAPIGLPVEEVRELERLFEESQSE